LGGKYFNRLKIGGKLTIGFGILGALTMLVIGLSYLGSYRATLNINRTGEVHVPLALASARAQANLLRMQADVQAYLALGDDTYRASYHQARQAFEADLARLDELARRHAASPSNPEFDQRLNALKSAYAEWSALPEQLFDLRDDQLKREPALRLLSTIAANTGVAIENARLFQTERAQAGRQAALFRLSAAIAAALDEDEICRRVVEGLQDEALGYAYVAVFLLDLVTGERVERAKVGWSDSDVPIRLGPGQGLSEKPLLDGHLHYTPDVTQAPDYVATLSSGSEVDAPLKIGQEVVGVLVVESRQPNAFGQDDFDVITAAANQAGVALGRARLLEETKQAREAAEVAAQELSQALENLKATQSQLVEAEKMAALGGLVAGVAHEINTPVGVGVTAASLLEDKTATFRSLFQNGQMKRSDLEKYLDTASQSSRMILKNLQRAAELIHSFKQVAVDQSSEERRPFVVRAYLEEILLSLHPKLKRTQLTLETRGDENLTLDSYPGAFAQIVTNLVMNSLIHAYEPNQSGKLIFDLKQKDGSFIFEYADDGRGISKENLSKIFDPFFTTKRGQGGSGLGLHIIYNLVTQKLGGTIRCESEVGRGTRFMIELPMALRSEK
jgi:signal transduction histidine kinase/CHASE3 domain sensor protein